MTINDNLMTLKLKIVRQRVDITYKKLLCTHIPIPALR